MIDFQAEREQMINEQLIARGVTDKRVLDAFRRVPRHEFVPIQYRDEAYVDHPLSIGEGQTISQPYMVALMTEALNLAGKEKVLEIGAGSGYQAAILSCLARDVYSVERLPELALEARERLKRLGFNNVEVKVGDGTLGWDEFAPYDAIIVTAGANQIPNLLLQQLSDGGKLVIPVGSIWFQNLRLVTKSGDEYFEESLGGCRFVPLIGEYGWKEGV